MEPLPAYSQLKENDTTLRQWYENVKICAHQLFALIKRSKFVLIYLFFLVLCIGSLVIVPRLDRENYNNSIRDIMSKDECQCKFDYVSTIINETIYCKEKTEYIFLPHTEDFRPVAGVNQTCYVDHPVINDKSVHYVYDYLFLDKKGSYGLIAWFVVVAVLAACLLAIGIAWICFHVFGG